MPLPKLVNFGSLVIGKARAAMQRSVTESKVTKFGPLVIGTKVLAGTNTPAPASMRVAAGAVSVNTLREMLETNKGLFPAYFNQELLREDGPRRGALRVFLDLAPDTLRDRDQVLALCQALLDLPVDAPPEAKRALLEARGVVSPVMAPPPEDADADGG